MAKHPLFTTGYAGFDADGFLYKLRFDKIEVVVDVRDNPFSRNRAFSKSALQKFLTDNHVEYVHMKPLGVPATLRHEHRDSGGDLADYFSAYRQHLRGQEEAVAALTQRALEKRCCLLCLEKDPAECHRSVLAEWITSNRDDLEVIHI